MKSLKDRALTLIELIVVLFILIALTTVTLRTTQGVIEQGRVDVTDRTLTDLEAAIVGDTRLRQPDGTPQVTGFVADVGRLPNTMRELVENPFSGTYQFAQSTEDTTVEIGTGWRGPYLRLPVGLSVNDDAISVGDKTTGDGYIDLTDGFGNQLEYLNQAGTASATTEEIAIVRSRGSNEAVDTGGEEFIDRDQTRNLRANALGDIVGTVTDSSTGNPPSGTFAVFVFFPNGSGGVASKGGTVNATTGSFTITEVPVGPRAIRVYDTSSVTTPSAATAEGPVSRIIVVPGTVTKDFTITP